MLNFLNTLNPVLTTYKFKNVYSDQRLILGPHDAISIFLLGCVVIELIDCVYDLSSSGFNLCTICALTKSQHHRFPHVDPLITVLSL